MNPDHVRKRPGLAVVIVFVEVGPVAADAGADGTILFANRRAHPLLERPHGLDEALTKAIENKNSKGGSTATHVELEHVAW